MKQSHKYPSNVLNMLSMLALKEAESRKTQTPQPRGKVSSETQSTPKSSSSLWKSVKDLPPACDVHGSGRRKAGEPPSHFVLPFPHVTS